MRNVSLLAGFVTVLCFCLSSNAPDAWKEGLPEGDLYNDGFLDLMDIAQFATDWLGCNRVHKSELWQ